MLFIMLSKGLKKISLDGILQKQRAEIKQLSVRITEAFRIPDGEWVKCHCHPVNVRPLMAFREKRRQTEQHKVKSTVQLMDQLVLFHAYRLDYLSLNKFYGLTLLSTDDLSTWAHGKAWALCWETKTRCL